MGVRIQLSDAERQIAQSYIDKWNDYALSAVPANHQECEKAVADIYRSMGKPLPPIVWLDNPRLGLAKVLALKSDETSVNALNQINNELTKACLWSHMEKLPYGSVKDFNWNVIFGMSDRPSVWANVWRKVRDAWWPIVAGTSVIDYAYFAPIAGNVFADMFSLIDYIVHERKEEALTPALPLLTLARNLKQWWVTGDTVYLIENPVRLELNAENELHSTTGKAIKYKDGYGFYALGGIIVEEAPTTT